MSVLAGVEAAGPSLPQLQNGTKLVAMRHGKRVARLARPADQRKALVRNLTTEVLRHGKIRTTVVRLAKLYGSAGDGGMDCTAQDSCIDLTSPASNFTVIGQAGYPASSAYDMLYSIQAWALSLT